MSQVLSAIDYRAGYFALQALCADQDQKIAALQARDAGQTERINALESLVADQAEELMQCKSAIGELKDEIAALKKKPKRPKLKPSGTGGKGNKGDGKGGKGDRSGEDGKRGRGPRQETADRKIVVDLKFGPSQLPPGSVNKGFREYRVNEIRIESQLILFRRQCFQRPDGRTVVAPLPDGIKGHFGPQVRRLIQQLYHQCQMTQK